MNMNGELHQPNKWIFELLFFFLMIGDTLVCLLYVVSLNTHTYNSILQQMEEGIQTLVPGDEENTTKLQGSWYLSLIIF